MAHPSQTRHARLARTCHAVRTRLEALEDRMVLSGFLDPTFGVGGTGTVVTNFPGSGNDFGKAPLVQPDGRTVVFGTSDGMLALARYDANGDLDGSFGTHGDGRVVQDYRSRFGSDLNLPSAALQADGKIVVAGSGSRGWVVARFNASGTLDTSFGDGGWAFALGDFGSRNEATGVAIQGDKIIVVGFSNPGDTSLDFVVARFDATGAPDTTFGGGKGWATADFGGIDMASGVAVQADGTIVVAGSTFVDPDLDPNPSIALARFKADGTPDPSFGTSGLAKAHIPNNDWDYATAVAAVANGKVVVVYGTGDGTGGVARFDSRGTLDTGNFGVGGYTSFGQGFAGNTVTAQGSNILVAGSIQGATTGRDFAVVRYTASGALDTTFGSGGTATVDFNSQNDGANGVAVQADGRIVVAGASGFVAGASGQGDFALARLTADGTLDTTSSGVAFKTTTDFAPGADDVALGVVSQDNSGRLVVLEYSGSADQPAKYRLVRYNADGTKDTTFGAGGEAIISFGSSDFHLVGLAVTPSDGGLIVVGNTGVGFAARILMAHFSHNGLPGWSYRGAVDYGTATGVAVQGDKIVVAGYIYNGGSGNDIVVERFDDRGSPDPSFGDSGFTTADVGLGFIGGRDVSVAPGPGGTIVVAGTGDEVLSGGAVRRIVVARFTGQGVLDPTFDLDGKATIDPGPQSSIEFAGVAVQTDGKIVVAGTTYQATGINLTLMRLTGLGAPDTSFGVGGTATADFGSKNEAAIGVATQGSKIVVAGTTYQDGTGSDFAVARFDAAGALDRTFDGDGKATVDFGSFDDVALGMAVQPDGKIAVAGRSRPGNTRSDVAVARFVGDAVRIEGTSGNDSISVDPGTQAGTLMVTVNGTVSDNVAGPVLVNGLGGSDAYTVNLGTPTETGTLMIADTGTDGSDTLTVNGTIQNDTLLKNAGSIRWRLSGDTTYRQEVNFDGMEGVTLNAGAGDDTIIDPNSGNLRILGGPGNDTITVADTTGPVTVDGGDGSDTYIVQAGDLHGPVTINDTGTAGTNSVSIVGSPAPDTFIQSGNQVTANGATITLGAGVSNLTIDGGGGTGDAITVNGTPTITPTVQGVSDTVVMGTAGNDTILVTPVGNTGQVKVKLNGTLVGTFHPAGKLIVYGLAGNDDIQVAGDVAIPCWLYGGDGDDRLKGGGGNNVLVGGAGDDLLTGGNDRDLLIGGTGADRIVGSAADDILIAGSTAYDANDLALAAVMAEWTSARSYAERVRDLRGDSTGNAFGSRTNGGYYLAVDGTYGRATTVFDDGVIDVLTGSAGQDWFLFNADGDGDARKKDKATDLSAAEFADDLDFIGAP